MDFDFHKLTTSPEGAGLLGALVGLRFAPGLSWLERLGNTVTGLACASFIAPAAGELFKHNSPTMIGFLAFVLGMFGMSCAAALAQGIRDLKLADIISGWISRKG